MIPSNSFRGSTSLSRLLPLFLFRLEAFERSIYRHVREHESTPFLSWYCSISVGLTIWVKNCSSSSPVSIKSPTLMTLCSLSRAMISVGSPTSFKVGGIVDNCWLAESPRVGRVCRLRLPVPLRAGNDGGRPWVATTWVPYVQVRPLQEASPQLLPR